MAIERTFSIIKPDATRRNLTGKVTACLEEAGLQGSARGLAFQLRQGLGSVSRAAARQQIAALGAKDRKTLRALGVRLGIETVFISALLKPKAMRMRALLWPAFHRIDGCTPPAPGLVTAIREKSAPDGFYAAIGYREIGDRVVRIDMIDRVGLRLMRLARKGPFALPADLCTLLGVAVDQAAEVVAALGYEPSADDGLFVRAAYRNRKKSNGKQGQRKPRQKGKAPRPGHAAPDSPFARLADLRLPS